MLPLTSLYWHQWLTEQIPSQQVAICALKLPSSGDLGKHITWNEYVRYDIAHKWLFSISNQDPLKNADVNDATINQFNQYYFLISVDAREIEEIIDFSLAVIICRVSPQKLMKWWHPVVNALRHSKRTCLQGIFFFVVFRRTNLMC